MSIEKIHHVAYRCRDAKETVEFYGKVLGMELLGIAFDKVAHKVGEVNSL